LGKGWFFMPGRLEKGWFFVSGRVDKGWLIVVYHNGFRDGIRRIGGLEPAAAACAKMGSFMV
jgi:hypothetical protein